MKKTIIESCQISFSKINLGIEKEEYTNEYLGVKLGYRALKWEYLINGKTYHVKSHTTFKKSLKNSNCHISRITKLIYDGIEFEDNDKKLISFILKNK